MFCPCYFYSQDFEDVSHIMELTDQWNDKLTNFMKNLREAESKQRKNIESVHANIVKWHKFYEDKSRSVKEILFSLYFCYFFIDFALFLVNNKEP